MRQGRKHAATLSLKSSILWLCLGWSADARQLRHADRPAHDFGGAPRGPQHHRSHNFVRVQGTHFVSANQSFHFQGTNNFYLAQAWMERHRVEHAMRTHGQAGLTVVRFWPFGDAFNRLDLDWTRMEGLAGGLGFLTLSEEAFLRLDWVLHVARHSGLRVIMPFINFEDHLFSIRWFVQQLRGPGAPLELFYCDATVIAAFKLYVYSIMYRTNAYNGLQYRQDDTILAWDLMNEPHTTDGFEQLGSQAAASNSTLCTDSSRQLVGRWLCHMGAFVHANDPDHLVTSGEEGYLSSAAFRDKPHARGDWIHNGLKGVDFAENAKCGELSFLTVHVYPDNWNIPYGDYQRHVGDFLRTRRDIAHSAGKPVIVEEYGCCLADDYKGKRKEVLAFMHDQADMLGYAGTIVWSLAHEDSSVVGDHYGFSYMDPAAEEVVRHAQIQIAKSGNLGQLSIAALPTLSSA